MIAERLVQLERRTKRALLASTDCLAVVAALWLAMALRLGDWQPDIWRYWPALIACLLAVPVFASLGLYAQVNRYLSQQVVPIAAKGGAVGAMAVAGIAYFIPLTGFPRSVPVIFWMIAVLYVAGSRFGIYAGFGWLNLGKAARIRVIIYGAGRKGVQLAHSLVNGGRYEPVAYIDDDERLQRRTIDGAKVHPPEDLATLIAQAQAREVLVSVGSDEPINRRRILKRLEPHAVRVRLIPDIDELRSENDHPAKLRDVQIRDLLGRTEVAPLPHLLKKSVAGRQVMVTGAGGSIGSELCRRIVRQGPQQLVLLDHSEYSLFKVRREIKQICAAENLDVAIHDVLGSVTNRTFIRHNLASYGVETLYHAAAYKHINLLENNVAEGLKNNTFGTLYTAEEAMRTGVKDFILISTDKAVRTSSVLGASKRLAEMALQALQQKSESTCFSIVRFGNVLNSSGSVVPLFMDQIKKGGPITVTHREATRYFMTIREAAELVMQAASMARGGDMFLLEMGAPIKILDLAVQMARLQGYSIKSEDNPDGDIEIQFTGLNRGEKLHEDLLVGNVSGTNHRNIMRAEEQFLPWPELRKALEPLEQACANYDHQVIHSFAQGLGRGADLETILGEVSAPRSAKAQASVATLPTSHRRRH